MINAIHGPLISQPAQWVVVFDPVAANRWIGALTPGKYKHVRAYGYVPFLHVWLFVDAYLAGIEIRVAANGDPANMMAEVFTRGCDVVLMPRRAHTNRSLLTAGAGWCVPVVKRLIGLNSCALRPDRLFADCLANGGQFYEIQHTHRPGVDPDREHQHGWQRILCAFHSRRRFHDRHDCPADADGRGASRHDSRGHPDLQGAHH